MPSRPMCKKIGRLLIVSGPVILLDQASKAVVLNTMRLYESIPVIPGFFNLTHIHNPGGAFGFLAGQSPAVRSFFFLVVAFLAMGLVLHFYFKTPSTHPYLRSAFALIFGGAVGNLIDRLRFGKVVDFLDFYVGALHWPAFNVADSAITVGISVFVLHLVFNRMPE
ncbi:MAG: signal peptidase II [Desulfobacteraceae bacterium]